MAAWEFSGVNVEKEAESDEEEAVDPCPSFFLKEPLFFVKDAGLGAEVCGSVQAENDLQAMAVA